MQILKRYGSLAYLSLGLILGSINALGLVVGDKAPDFTVTDSKGKKHSLSQYKGKHVVLEWVNYECPFVKKHYNSENMQKLQKKYGEKDVVWLSICSSGKDQQGNFSPSEINSRIAKGNASCSAYLIDEDGAVGRKYGAKTTPHIYIVGPSGVLVYQGAIDSIPSYDEKDVAGADNYISLALDAAMAGKPIEHHTTKPYGCSVKYGD